MREQNIDTAALGNNAAMSGITLILKCTRECNLCCTYCTDRRKKSQTFDIPFVAHLFDNISKIDGMPRVTFIWHGGEPLLLGIPFFRKVHFLQHHFFSSGRNFFNTIQTNACLLNEEWVAHFREYGFQVGVSLDGPIELHNSTRILSDGRGSFSSVLAGIDLLRKANLRFGILTVISEAHIQHSPKRLMEFFEKHSISKYSLLSLRKNWKRQDHAITYNRAFGEFMSTAMKHWLTKDDSKTQVRELDSKMDLFFGLPNAVCKDGGPCVGKYFGVEADGGLWHCDKFADDDRFYFGNFLDTSLNELIKSDRIKKACDYEKSIRQRCRDCPWFQLCKGGCLADLIYLCKIGGRIGTIDCINFRLFEELSGFLNNYYQLVCDDKLLDKENV